MSPIEVPQDDGDETRRDGVDIGLIRDNLALSYEERIEQHQDTIELIDELRQIGTLNRAKITKPS